MQNAHTVRPKRRHLWLWIGIFVVLILAVGAWVHSYYQAQQLTTEQTRTSLLLERMNQLQRNQDQALKQNQLLQQQLEAEVNENLTAIRVRSTAVLEKIRQTANNQLEQIKSEISRAPDRLSHHLLQQLITQAHLLAQASPQSNLISTLLNEALNIAQNTNAQRYHALIAALEADIATLDLMESEANTSRVMAQIDALRSRVRALDFSLAPQPNSNAEDSTNPAEAEKPSLLGSFYTEAKDILRKLVVVSRHEQSVKADLSLTQFTSAKMMIEATLIQAQTALLLSEKERFQLALSQAKALMETYLLRFPLSNVFTTVDQLIRQKHVQALSLQSQTTFDTLEAIE